MPEPLVAPGGWCAPIAPMYDLFTLSDTPDVTAWWGPDWDRLVAPRLTRFIRGYRAVRREVRWRLGTAWDALRHGRRDDEEECW